MAFRISMDANGIPLSHYGVYRGIDIGDQRSITAVAEAGLYYWNCFFAAPAQQVMLSYNWDTTWPVNRDALPQNQQDAKEKILNCAQWLCDNAQQQGDFCVWTYPYALSYGLPAGWRSGQAQIAAIQLLYRAHALAQDEAFRAIAEKALQAFSTPVSQGGMAEETAHGLRFEKLIAAGHNAPSVLNGTMFVLLGLRDCAAYTAQKKRVSQLFEQGLLALVHYLPRFDNGTWSCYDDAQKLASDHYHAIHIRQLQMLYHTARNPTLRRYARRFQWYRMRKALLQAITSLKPKKKKSRRRKKA